MSNEWQYDLNVFFVLFFVFVLFLFCFVRFWLTRLSLLLQTPRIQEDEHELKFVKKRRSLNLEKILSKSEPLIARDSNGVMPFPLQNRNDIEMTGSAQEQGPMKIKNIGHRTWIAKAIDYASRFLFPVAFISFNVFYWYHFLNAV